MYIFQFVNDKIHNYVLFAIIVHFNIQKLKNKHTFMQTEKAKSSHFDRTREDKNQIFHTLVNCWNFIRNVVAGSRQLLIIFTFFSLSLNVHENPMKLWDMKIWMRFQWEFKTIVFWLFCQIQFLWPSQAVIKSWTYPEPEG